MDSLDLSSTVQSPFTLASLTRGSPDPSSELRGPDLLKLPLFDLPVLRLTILIQVSHTKSPFHPSKNQSSSVRTRSLEPSSRASTCLTQASNPVGLSSRDLNLFDVTSFVCLYWMKTLSAHSDNCRAAGFRIGDGSGLRRNRRRPGETKSIWKPSPSQLSRSAL